MGDSARNKKIENNVTEYTTLSIWESELLLIPIWVTGDKKTEKGQFVYIDIEKNTFKVVKVSEIYKTILFDSIKLSVVKDSEDRFEIYFDNWCYDWKLAEYELDTIL